MELESIGSEHALRSAPATSHRAECMHRAVSLALLAGVIVHQVEVFVARVELVSAVDSAVVLPERLCGCPLSAEVVEL